MQALVRLRPTRLIHESDSLSWPIAEAAKD